MGSHPNCGVCKKWGFLPGCAACQYHRVKEEQEKKKEEKRNQEQINHITKWCTCASDWEEKVYENLSGKENNIVYLLVGENKQFQIIDNSFAVETARAYKEITEEIDGHEVVKKVKQKVTFEQITVKNTPTTIITFADDVEGVVKISNF